MTDTLFDIEQESSIDLDEFDFIIIDAVTGSGYEEKVSALALHDGVAHRAARPNMQKFPALIVERKEDRAFEGEDASARNQVFPERRTAMAPLAEPTEKSRVHKTADSRGHGER